MKSSVNTFAAEYQPATETADLLALMFLTHARTPALTDEAGEIVPLDEQDRSRRDQQLVHRGTRMIENALRRRVCSGGVPSCVDPDGHRFTLGRGEERLRDIADYYGMTPDEISIDPTWLDDLH